MKYRGLIFLLNSFPSRVKSNCNFFVENEGKIDWIFLIIIRPIGFHRSFMRRRIEKYPIAIEFLLMIISCVWDLIPLIIHCWARCFSDRVVVSESVSAINHWYFLEILATAYLLIKYFDEKDRSTFIYLSRFRGELYLSTRKITIRKQNLKYLFHFTILKRPVVNTLR